MAATTMSKAQPKEEWIEQFMAEEQKRADALGLNLIEYYMQVEDGLLRPTMLKMLRHVKAHPDRCPSNCSFQTSIRKLKARHSTS